MKVAVTRIIAIFMVLAMIAAPVSSLTVKPVSANGGISGRGDLVPTGHTPVDKYRTVDTADLVDKNAVSRYIVIFDGPSLTRAQGSANINHQFLGDSVRELVVGVGCKRSNMKCQHDLAAR